ncbi:nucleoside phosphorylase [Reichenbachiella sp. MSK19-1]|uniref:nucleoside phosphorylase n=1 Tax=Reichenbachiella sp. MSK19-1 TaxID=1897631 RepID=UPI000E6CD674|nr:nucleoside phosphorylase [Reichenbachiella sp. MSK19-1]RJE71901.1 phosphorylase [Reichenbachiella sp. MSK19-1]
MQTISETDLILNKDGSVYHLNLKPENISDTILTVGDPSRVFRVSQYFDTIDFEMNRREFITHKGTYKGKKVTVISTGMGTDNVEIFMTELDALVNVDLKTRQVKEKKKKLNIIRIGTSGSLQEDLRLGSHLVSDFGVGLDTLMTFYNLRQTGQENTVTNKLRDYLDFPFKPYCVEGSTMLREKFAFDMVRGNTVTCPGFYGPQGRNVRLDLKYPHLMEDLMYFHEEDFWLTNFEMETAGYYALGRLMGHEMLSLNAIIANRAKNKFSKDPDRVIDSLIRKVLERL